MHDFSWQDYPDTGRSNGSYIICNQGGPVVYNIFVPPLVAILSAEAECNAEAVAGMPIERIKCSRS